MSRTDVRTIARIAGTAGGLVGFLSQLRRARRDADRLRLVYAVLNGLMLVTGTALVLRGMRRGGA